MNKIKIIGALIFILSILLASLFSYTSEKNQTYNDLLDTINEQRAFTQEISKQIFYIHREEINSTKELDILVHDFVRNTETRKDTIIHDKKIVFLWNKFYLQVQKFRDQNGIKTPYSNIVLEKIIKDIYNTNQELIIEFNKLTEATNAEYYKKIKLYKYSQYLLFALLVLMLLYLFTQLNSVMLFVQKFIITSKNIITKSTIKELKPICVTSHNNDDIHNATKNFNTLIEKINSSIEHSKNSIEYSRESLQMVEQNIEELFELIYTMNEEELNKEFAKKEDAIIQSLEELTVSSLKLKNLKSDLDSIISINK